MIHSITGIITIIDSDYVHICVNGIEYGLCVSLQSRERLLPFLRKECKVFTFLHISDRHVELYGFALQSEKNLFLSLQKVEGIGPKAALRILSHTNPQQFMDYVQSHDIKGLSTLPGVGKKKASKILLALEDVFRIIPSSQEDDSIQEKKTEEELIVRAICDMGYNVEEVKSAVRHAISIVCNSENKNNDHEDIRFLVRKEEGKIMKEAISFLESSYDVR